MEENKSINSNQSKPNNIYNAINVAIITNTVLLISFNQGVQDLGDISVKYLFKDDFGLKPAESQILLGWAHLAWMIKPIWGYLSDSHPFMGYRRKSYLIAWTFLQWAAWMSMSTWITTYLQAFVALCFIYTGLAFCNVIGEAIIVEVARNGSEDEENNEEQKQQNASKNVSLFFGTKYFGVFLTSYTGGALLSYITKRDIFFITSFFPAIVFLYSFKFPEQRINPQDRNMSLEQQQIQQDKNHNIKLLWKFVTKPQILYPIAFIFVSGISPSTSSAMFYFYTNKLGFTPEFMGQVKLVNAMAAVGGIMLYHNCLKNVDIKVQLFWSTILGSLMGMTVILLVTGKNRELGIPDKLFILCDSLILQVINQINHIPVLVFAARICPKNIEGTMYALLTSMANFSSLVSENLGGIVTQYFGISSTEFDNLWKIVLIQNLFVLLPLPWLGYINFKQAENLADQNPDGEVSENNEDTVLLVKNTNNNKDYKTLTGDKDISYVKPQQNE